MRYFQTLGFKIVFFDLLMTYVVAAAINLVAGRSENSNFRQEILSPEVMFPFACMLFTVLLLGQVMHRGITATWGGVLARLPRIGTARLWMMALVFLGLSVAFFLMDMGRNRYDSVSAADDVGGATLGIVLNFFKAFFGVLIAARFARIRLSDAQACLLTVCLAMALIVDGMAHVMLLAIFLAAVLAPRMLAKINTAPWWLRAVALALAIMGAWALFRLGVFWKSGELVPPGDALSDLRWLVGRLSTLLYSANVAAQLAAADWGFFLAGWDISVSEVAYKSCVVLGLDDCWAQQGDFSSLARFNFANITVEDPGRGGASPGVLGSMLYLVPYPLAGFVAGFYLVALAALINCLPVEKPVRFRLITFLCLAYLFRIALLSPAALLNPMSSPFLGGVGVVLGVRAVGCLARSEAIRREKYANNEQL